MESKSSYLLILVLCFGFALSSFGQLVVDAGKDTTYCTGAGTMYLGNHITIRNGIEPYSISWECKVPKGSYSYFTANDLLNDTSALTPIITYTPSNNNWIKFTIHVTDGENHYTKDSIRVRFSKFAYTTGYLVFELNKGDSLLFTNSSVGGGIEPLKYHWQPKTGLSNADTLVTWCKTDSLTEYRTQYDVIAIDSCGCISNPNLVYEIRVIPTGIQRLNIAKENILNIKQDGNSIYFDNPFGQDAHITIFSMNGAVLQKYNLNNDHFEISNFLKIKGIYFVKISVGNQTGANKFINL